jgi:CRP-like cAMP-binding protein
MSFHLPGDIPDLQSWHMDLMDHDLVMLRAGKVAFIPHNAISSVMERHPRVAVALWRDALIDAAITREWLVCVGRRSSYSRLAHLLCELIARAQAVGLAERAIDYLPTQQELGDATGLSVVHVNRTMRQLRTDGLIATAGKRLNVLNWEGLKRGGQFDQTYLRLEVQV